MDERTKIFIEQTSSFLKEMMIEKGLNANQLLKKAKENSITLNQQQLYSVLNMGKPSRPNYSIETFVKVISLLGVHLDLTGNAPSKN